MKTALYSNIRIDDQSVTEAQVITRAQKAGYNLVVFNGFDNDDCKNRKTEMAANRAILREIEDLFPDGQGYSSIYIAHTAPEPKQISAEDDADFQISATFK